jgi:drug/metabolite transporter (DMT)-like permease
MTSPRADRTRLAILLTLAVMLAFAVMDGLTKVLSQSLAIPQILWFRSIVFASLAIAMLRLGAATRDRPIRDIAASKRPILQFSRALLLVVESGLYMVAFSLLPLADVHAVGAVSPLIVVALSVPFLGETVGWRRWAAVGVGFIGVLVIVRPGMTAIHPATVITLVAAAMWAAYQIMVRLAARTDSSETTSLWTALVGLGASSLVGATTWVWPTPTGWMLLIAVALLGAFAHITLITALGMTKPSLLQPFSYTLFVWAIVVGYALFGEVPDVWTLAGASLIIASGVYAWHRERVRAGQPIAPII